LARRRPDPLEVAEVIDGLLGKVDSGEWACTTRRERAIAQQLRGAATAVRAFGEAASGELSQSPAGASWGPARAVRAPRGGGGHKPADAHEPLGKVLAALARAPRAGWGLVKRVSSVPDGSPSAYAAVSVLQAVLRADQDLASRQARASWAGRRARAAAQAKREGGPAVARVLELRRQGLSLRAICRALDDEGVPKFSDRSRAWPVSSVQWAIKTYGGTADG
jgi:hypothetical protein